MVKGKKFTRPTSAKQIGVSPLSFALNRTSQKDMAGKKLKRAMALRGLSAKR